VEERGEEGKHREMMALFPPVCLTPRLLPPLPSSTPYASDTHSHMLLSVKVLKDIVTQILKKQSLSTHPCVTKQF